MGLILILQLLLHHTHYTVSQPTFSYYKCIDKYGNYTSESQYGKNLQKLLLQNTPNTQNDFNFYNFSVGHKAADRVYAIALCRGDITAANCRTCIDEAKTELMKQCPVQKEAIGHYYSECMLRYSDRLIFRTMELTPVYPLYGSHIAPDTTGYKNGVRLLLDKLKKQAAAGGSHRKFALGEANITTSLKLYALTQCTPDLSQSDCTTCLEAAIRQFSSCCTRWLGVAIKLPSCFFKMENYKFYNSQQSITTKTPPPSFKSKSENKIITYKRWIIIVLASTVFLLLVAVVYCTSRRLRKVKKKAQIKAEDGPNSYFDSIKYDFNTVKAATEDFSDTKKLIEGAPMYTGVLPGGEEIVVKKLSNSCTSDTEEYLKNEALILTNLQQRNLVKFLGSCVGEDQSLLIYEFLPNRSLDLLLYDPIRRMCLHWETRRTIITGIARGLVYLHEDSHFRVIHCNLKASNILLGADMNPKISNFKMARLIDADQTTGDNKTDMSALHKIPEHVQRERFSIASDVFDFGVLLLEIICGHKIRDFVNKEHEDFLSFAWKKWSEGTVFDIVDPTMPRIQCHTNQIVRCIRIGFLCLQASVTCRPTMSTILFMLNSSMIVIEEPSPPGSLKFTDIKKDQLRPLVDGNHLINMSNETSINETSISLPEPR